MATDFYDADGIQILPHFLFFFHAYSFIRQPVSSEDVWFLKFLDYVPHVL